MSAGIVVIRNGLVNHMATCGPWKAAEISSCDYGVMEHVAACGLMLRPSGESPVENLTKGTAANYLVNWNIGGELWLRYTGDSPTFLAKIWQGMDDIVNTLAKDVTLGNSACYATLTNISYNVNEGLELGGFDYGLIKFNIMAQDL